MTATERLRQLLDERGVEWEARDGKTIKNTYWDDLDGRRWGYVSDESESLKDRQLFLIRGRMDISPEQAVEATLGRGTCKVVSKPCDMWECECGKAWWHGGAPNYCPSCGRRVES